MLHIQVVCVGKMKEKYWVDACAEYAKRLTAYCKLTTIEVADEKAPDHCTEHEMNLIKDKEGQRILAALRSDDFVVALAIQGQSWSSEQLANQIEDWVTYGKSRIVFVIGGSLGLANGVLERADVKLSFSKMTFPHQMVRVFLLEQVYRAFRIIRGHAYHR
jgi:23S rRNA (pseudouridine1915-N3)-methyltransferase